MFSVTKEYEWQTTRLKWGNVTVKSVGRLSCTMRLEVYTYPR